MKLEKWEAMKLLKLIANEMVAAINDNEGAGVSNDWVRERLKELMKYVDVIDGDPEVYVGQHGVTAAVAFPKDY